MQLVVKKWIPQYEATVVNLQAMNEENVSPSIVVYRKGAANE